ncbi:MAG: hypothetical protein LBT38_03135 [Deltaproteobacteria bacterium]|nr:hypothetical protein [Deltaproteobacteria bacterium]
MPLKSVNLTLGLRRVGRPKNQADGDGGEKNSLKAFDEAKKPVVIR